MPWGTPSALAQPMNAVLVPPGIRAGDVFNLQLPTGESRDVTCPHGACEGQLLQVWRLIPSVDAPPADPDAVLAKLPKHGFVLGKPPLMREAPGDGDSLFCGVYPSHGMHGEQQLTDVDGESFARIIYTSSNLEKGQCSVRIVAVDGSVLASFDKPKEATVQDANLEARGFGVTVFLGDLPYANVVAEAMRPGAGQTKMTLTRASGTGGMKAGDRSVVLVQQNDNTPMTPISIFELTDERDRRLVPLLGYKSTLTCAFAVTSVPASLSQAINVYLDDEDSMGIPITVGLLEGPARLDALLIAVISQAACLLRAGLAG